jgi:hypothetical protein
METAIIVDILRRAGAKVIVASVETEHTVGGTSNPIRPVAKPFRCNQLDHTDNCCLLAKRPQLSGRATPRPIERVGGNSHTHRSYLWPHLSHLTSHIHLSHHPLATLRRSAPWREA